LDPAAAATEAPATPAVGAPRRKAPPLLVRLCVAVVLPIFAATTMAIVDGWTPVGDSATLALRTGDVTRGSPPLTGMPTTADRISSTEELDHPGPLEVWLAALPYRILGPPGLLVLVAMVNAASLVVAVRVGWRRGGPPLAMAVTGTALLLSWSLGAETIRDPLNTHIGLLPWFATLLLAWEVSAGRWRSLPLAVAGASWVVQAHVVWILPAAVLLTGTAVIVRRHELARPEPQRARRAGVRRLALRRAAVVGVVLNLPILIDQVAGNGNLLRMASFGGQPSQGLRVALRTTVSALGLPPAWLRTGVDPFLLLRTPTFADVVGFGAVAGASVWLVRSAKTGGQHRALGLVHIAALGVAGAALVVARTPKGGAIAAADAMLLWWPVTAIAWLGIGWAVWSHVHAPVERWLAQGARQQVVGAVAVLCALGLVTLTALGPARPESFGAAMREPASAIGPEVVAAMAGQRLVQVNADGWAARLYLRHAVIEQLERAGIATKTGDVDRAFRRHGDGRGAPSATVWVVSDPVEPAVPEPGASLLTRTDLVPGGPFSPAAERRRMVRRQLDEAGRVRLRGSGRITAADVSQEFFRWTTPPPDGAADLPASWVSVDAYVELARNGLIATPEIDPALVEQVHRDSIGRYFAAEDTEVAIFVRYAG
jgi:hypothetical protein